MLRDYNLITIFLVSIKSFIAYRCYLWLPLTASYYAIIKKHVTLLNRMIILIWISITLNTTRDKYITN